MNQQPAYSSFLPLCLIYCLMGLTTQSFAAPQTASTSSKAEQKQKKDHKKQLVHDSFEELGVAMRLQRKCQILELSDENALKYYTLNLRKTLNETQSPQVIVALNKKASLNYQKKVTASKGNNDVLCNKESMSLIEETLTSATIVNEMLGHAPFDPVKDRQRIIMNILKKTAQIKGASQQCTKQMQEPSFSKLAKKISLNTIILSAMARMQGIKVAELTKIKLMTLKAGKSPAFKHLCQVATFQKHNDKMTALISQLRQ